MTVTPIRARMLEAVPWWLSGSNLGRLIYTIGLHYDAFLDASIIALKRRFPGLIDYEELAMTGRERRMRRGPWETDEQFSARLPGWLEVKRIAGATALTLRQIQAFLTPNTVANIEIVYNSGRRWNLSSSGVVSQSQSAWNWDGRTDLWSRYWVILHQPSWLTNDGTWEDSPESPQNSALTWGTSAVWTDVEGLRLLIHDHSPPHSHHMNTIVVLDESEWTAQQPNGTWHLMANRNPNVVYWDGTT